MNLFCLNLFLERLFIRANEDETISSVPLTYNETIALVRSVFEVIFAPY